MSQLETVVAIQRPVAQVFAYLADLRNMTAWAEGIVEVEAVTPDTTEPGTSYRLIDLLAGRRVATPITITQYEPGRSYNSVTRMGPLIFDDHWEFTSRGEGTQVRQVSDIHATGLLAPLGWLAAKLLEKRLAEDLRRAKRLLEATSSAALPTHSEEA